MIRSNAESKKNKLGQYHLGTFLHLNDRKKDQVNRDGLLQEIDGYIKFLMETLMEKELTPEKEERIMKALRELEDIRFRHEV